MKDEKFMDFGSMKKYVEERFEKFRKEDLYLCGENLCEADLTYYFGYFALAFELGLISEDREEEMTGILKDIYNDIVNGNSSTK